MGLRTPLHLTSGGKHIALVVALVLLALGILSFLQYRSMVDLEGKTKVAVKENLRQTLQGVERKIENRFENLGKEVLVPIDDLGAGERDNKTSIERHFTDAARRHPEINQLFFISNCDCRPKPDHYAYFFTQHGPRSLNYSALYADMDARNAMQAYEKADLSRSNLATSGHQLLYWEDSCPSCLSKGMAHLKTYIFYAVHGRDRTDTGFAGMSLNTDYIKEQLLGQIVAEAMQNSGIALAESDLAVAIFDERKQVIYANSKGNVQYEVRDAFSRPFPHWEIGIGFKGTTVGALARSNFYKNLLLTLVTLFVLLIGIFLILRAAGREMKLAQIKSDFVSNVSHELKTPLTMIRLSAEILTLGRAKNAEKAQEYFRIIENESRRLSQLIDNTLDFSRIEAGRKNYQFVESCIGDLVEDVINSYEHQIVNSGFELKVEIQPNLPAIMIDPAAISQAVLNLLMNAVKYSDAIKRIEIRVFQSGEYLGVEVTDKGIGIPRSEQQKIFEKFHRVGTALVHNTKGSGLGLTLVKHIVEAHQGQVRVKSTPGEGSSFTLLLPINNPKVVTAELGARAGGYTVAESLNN